MIAAIAAAITVYQAWDIYKLLLSVSAEPRRIAAALYLK